MAQKELYRLLREARAQKDDAACVRVLMQIVAADPQDAGAAAQLADLKKHMETAGGSRSNAQTKALFRELRQAVVAHDDESAYRTVQKILELDPQNKDAEVQKKEIGMRLAKQAAEPLSRLVENGDVAALVALVRRLRGYAGESFLQNLPEYSPAAYMADSHMKQEAAKQLEQAYAALQQITALSDREKAARGMEKNAMEAGVSFSQEQRSTLAAIHAEWESHCRTERMKERLSEISEQYAACRDSFRMTKDFAAAIAGLGACAEALAEVSDLPESADLAERVNRRIERVKSQQELHAFKVRMRKRIAVGSVAAVLALTAFCGYAYEHVEEMNARLAEAYEAHRANHIDSQLKTNPFLVKVCCFINSDYASNVTLCRRWLADWQKLRVTYRDNLHRMQQLKNKIRPENLHEIFELLVRTKEAENRLVKDFCDPPTHEQQMQRDEFLNALSLVQQQALEDFKTIAPGSSVSTLRMRYKDYVSMREALGVPEEENERVVKGFHDALLKNWQDAPSEAVLRKHLREFDEVAADMELPSSMRETLERRLAAFNQLAKLRDCRTVKDYLGKMEAYPEILALVPSACTLEQIRGMIEVVSAPEASASLSLEAMLSAGRLPADYRMSLPSNENCYRYLEKVSAVYERGESLYLGQSQPSALDGIIESMSTRGKDSAIWADRYKRISDGTTFYIGVVSTINGKYTVDIMNTSGDSVSRKSNLVPVETPSKVQLNDLRSKCMMKNYELRSGLRTPAELMENVARTDAPQYPVFARAYLFGLAVEMAEKLPNGFVSGCWLSQRMQKDIRRFKSLAAKSALREGCWVAPHKVATEREWKEFFASLKHYSYRDEIKASLNDILKKKLELGGYIDETRQLRSFNGSAAQLFYVKNGRVVPYDATCTIPFTPLFILR